MLLDDLIRYQCIKTEKPDLSARQILEKMGVVDSRLTEGVDRGIDPLRGHGQGRIDNRFLAAIAVSRAADEKMRVHNASVAVAKGKPCQRETAFKSASNVYTLRRIKEKLDHVHDNPEIAMFDQAVGGLNSGRVLKDELIHAMQDELIARHKRA